MPNAENDIFKIVILAVLGSNGVMAAILYWLNARSKIRLIEANSRAMQAVKRMEVQLERVKQEREKSAADEHQTDKIVALPSEILYMLGKTLDENREIRKYQLELDERIEENYFIHKGISDRHAQENKTSDENRDKALREYIHIELKAAVSDSQAQSASRTFLTDYGRGFRFPLDHDPRWKLCIVTMQVVIEAPIYDTPLHITGAGNKGKIGKLVTGNTAWVIDEMLSTIPGWCPIRLHDMPEVRGWVESRFVSLKACDTGTMKAVKGDEG